MFRDQLFFFAAKCEVLPHSIFNLLTFLICANRFDYHLSKHLDGFFKEKSFHKCEADVKGAFNEFIISRSPDFSEKGTNVRRLYRVPKRTE